MSVIRWGIAGYGWVASAYVAPAFSGLSGARLVAVCDPDPAARARAEGAGLGSAESLEELCARHAIDALYVATPNHLHRPVVERAAALGLHVLCEKPTATSLGAAEAMVAAGARAGRHFATAYDQRFHPAHRRLRDEIAAGRLGTVTAVRIVYACWVDPEWSADNWRIDAGRSGGGALVDLAPHGLDLAAYLLGEEVARAVAFEQRRVQAYEVDDGAVVAACTANGVLVQLHVAYNCPETLPRRRLEVQGTRGLAVATNTMGQTPSGTLDFVDAADGRSHRLPFDTGRSPFVALVGEFGARIATGGPAPDGAHDLHVMRLLETMPCR